MAKVFRGSWVVLILLLICCWPAAIIYFFIKYVDEVPLPAPMQGQTRVCLKCGQQIGVQYMVCPYCQAPVGGATASPQAPTATPAPQTCPTCNGQATYVPQYQKYYCYKCQKYL